MVFLGMKKVDVEKKDQRSEESSEQEKCDTDERFRRFRSSTVESRLCAT